MAKHIIKLTVEELIFLSKVLDHNRLYLLQIKKKPIGQDHLSSKNQILEGIYRNSTTDLGFTRRELSYLKNTLFQYFISSIKSGLFPEEKKFIPTYLNICKLLREPANDLLLTFHENET